MKRLLVTAVLLPVPAWADSPTLSAPALGGGQLLQTFLGLIFILLLIVALGWLLKRSQYFSHAAQGQLRIVSSLALGPRERAVVIQVGDEQLLVGVTAHNINLLQTLPEPLTVKTTQPATGNFADRLKQVLQQQRNA